LPALTQVNVDLVTKKITKITPHGITTADGVEHPAEVIIWGTNFRGTEFLAPMKITGIDGRDLHEQWSDGARAYYSMTVPHFPSLLIMYVPNTTTGSGSIIPGTISAPLRRPPGRQRRSDHPPAGGRGELRPTHPGRARR
jgi:cation diffusion facilitator CzcD-associated flavoprotein CzcO